MKNISISGTVSQNTCRSLAEDFRYLEGQEKSPHNWVGKKKEKMKREIKKGTNNSGRTIKVRRSSHIQKNHSPHSGEISWDRKGPSVGLKENAADSLENRTK